MTFFVGFVKAYIFKTSVAMGITLMAGQAWMARLQRDAMEFRGGKAGPVEVEATFGVGWFSSDF